ncbi:MAG: hypothetical protein HKN79_09930, partial [Flavobacteriales bacterium]|nr:hypothetical protein [Flavobacteriales bacterium]
MNRLLLLLSFNLVVLGIHAQSTLDSDDIDSRYVDEYGDLLKSSSFGNCAAFTATPSSSPVSCNGFDDGQACITVTSGVGPFTYLWLGESSTDSCLSNVDAGAYIVIVTDVGQGASCSWQITVSEPTAIGVISMNAVAPSCAGECDGQANPLVVGGNGGFMYSYDSGETTQAATMLCNPFQLTITDANGCTTDTLYTFSNAPDTIQIDGVVTDNICFGFDDGAIDVTVSGGVGTYDYSWSGPNGFSSSDEDISGLEPGVYDLDVTDDNSCFQSASFTVVAATDIVVDAVIGDVLCSGTNTGSIDITTSGGNPDYSYAWTGPSGFSSASEDLILLEAGEYFLTVTDIEGCTQDTSFTVSENPAIIITADITDNDCFGESEGAIDVTAISVSGISDYDWTGPGGFTSTSEDISLLAAGNYMLTVTDNLGCTADTIFTVDQADEIIFDLVVTDILCNADSTGAIDLTVSGGTPGYQYSWSGPNGYSSSDEDISNLVVGSYTIMITDTNDCVKDTTVTIIEPTAISVTESIIDLECNSDNTGAIDLEISGGTGAYTIDWSGPNGYTSTDEDIAGLEAGEYDLTVTDENLCEFLATYTIDQPDSLSIDIISTDLSCFNDSSGAIDITVTGGTGTYSYLWTGPDAFTSGDEDISDLDAGDYTVQVTDENLCTADSTITLSEPDAIILDTLVTQIACPGDENGSIDLTISGGSGTYTVSWTGPGAFSSSDEDISDLDEGIYTVVVTDDNLCSETLSVEIIDPLPMVITGVVTDVECFGEATGAIDITVTNGAGGFTYSWSGPNGYTSTDEDIIDLEAGTYTVTVTDANLCEQSNSFIVIENPEIMLSAVITDVVCGGDSTGAIDITVLGGQGDFTYAWSGPDGFTSMDEDLVDVPAGTYDVTVTDQLGCTEQESYTIDQPDPLTVTAALSDPLCSGEFNGDIDIAIMGGTPDHLITWTGPNGFSASGVGIDIADLEAGDYILNITDDEGCTLDTTFTLNDPVELMASLDITQPGCGLDNGEVSSTVSGGTVAIDYTYVWTDSTGDTIGTAATISGLG